jgi:F0F1-type ATP synthase membrane subunit c/vacuolar-type H+-ATPase subunit K
MITTHVHKISALAIKDVSTFHKYVMMTARVP